MVVLRCKCTKVGKKGKKKTAKKKKPCKFGRVKSGKRKGLCRKQKKH